MLPAEVEKRIQNWLNGPFEPQIKEQIQKWQKENPQALLDAFFQDLSFGTGSMRGLMGVGTNRMNLYTIGRATQGLANYLKQQAEPETGHRVFIGYDVRHHSREFAEEAARVLSGNGIHVFLSKEICPTPLVSFACRHLQCSAAIMITASHNPPQYNGYKVYWSDGAQVVPPQDQGILEEVAKIQSPEQIQKGSLGTEVGEEIDLAYLTALKELQLAPEAAKIPLSILYTNLHGTGIRLIPKALKDWGYSAVTLVEKQSSLDANFSFAPSPNPEEAKALQMGSEQLLKEKRDLLLATDPDADRMGAVVLDGQKAVPLTGNQIACLCLHHICSLLSTKEQFPANAACVKTIVTSELFRKITESFGATCIDVLTGFKYISEQIRHWENSFGAYQYLFGAEESYGYLFGTFVRDKDAISSACILAEAAALAKKQNLTLIDRLYQIYEKYGVHREALSQLAFSDSQAGMQQMQQLMQRLRQSPPLTIGDQKVISVEDYATGEKQCLTTGKISSMALPSSDVLRFWLADESKLVIRPSGTEPKVKIYAECVDRQALSIPKRIESCEKRLQTLMQAFQQQVLLERP